MMDRRHPKDAAPSELVRAHLQDHRGGLDYENTAHHQRYDLLAHHYGDQTECGAEGQCANVAHEDLRRIGVEPEKPETGAAQSAAVDQQVTGLRNRWNSQIAREDLIAARVGKHAK